jgi:hypothetical protein
MEIHSVHIETLHEPQSYSREQIEFASRLAAVLGRGRLVLVEPPSRRQ